MTAIAERPTSATRPLSTVAEATTPCTCGGVLAWNSLLGRWEHSADVCLPCATAGDVYCDDTCLNPAVFCSHAEPVTCENCSSEMTVEGCTADCDDAEAALDDPDRAYDLYRERDW